LGRAAVAQAQQDGAGGDQAGEGASLGTAIAGVHRRLLIGGPGQMAVIVSRGRGASDEKRVAATVGTSMVSRWRVPCPRLCVGMGMYDTSACPRKAVGMAPNDKSFHPRTTDSTKVGLTASKWTV